MKLARASHEWREKNDIDANHEEKQKANGEPGTGSYSADGTAAGCGGCSGERGSSFNSSTVIIRKSFVAAELRG
jgi:hypothetical protein